MKQVVRRLIQNAGMDRRFRLNAFEALEICRGYSIPVAKTLFARDDHEVLEAGEKIGYPVALKVVSPNALHKSQAGGVVLEVKSKEELRKACQNIRVRFRGRVIEGMVVQEMIAAGVEAIIGVSTDSQFGQVIMFGLGGVNVEFIKDVSFGIIPIGASEALEMIEGIKSFPLFSRNHHGLKELVHAMVRVSDMIQDKIPILELDLNPIILTQRGIRTVDARAVLRESADNE